ncbi:MAG: ABC transporter ATP-binding protein [Thermoanaerobaculia bacterium]
MKSGLQAVDLSVSYGSRPAIEGVAFRLEPGSVAAVVGENGSGKSTLLKSIAGVLDARAGEIRWNGMPITRRRPRETARKIAYAPQSVDLVFPISVAELVLQGRAPWRSGWIWESREDRDIAKEAMLQCDVAHLASSDAAKLSGGERRRVFLARMLAQQSDVWLLDEPTADLDPRHRLEFLDILRRAHQRAGTTILWATHDLNEALEIADHAIVMRGGRLLAAGPVSECLTEGTLERAFGVSARVERDASGKPRIAFFR